MEVEIKALTFKKKISFIANFPLDTSQDLAEADRGKVSQIALGQKILFRLCRGNRWLAQQLRRPRSV